MAKTIKKVGKKAGAAVAQTIHADEIPIRAVDANGLETPLPGAVSVMLKLSNGAVVSLRAVASKPEVPMVELRTSGRRMHICPLEPNRIVIDVEPS